MLSEFRDWSDVRVFLAVLREGSTLAAARRLGMAQPTVTRRIAALEQALGLTLFDRDTRGSRPTAAALALRAPAEALETSASALFAAAGRARSAALQPIRISSAGRNLSPNFAAILSDFSAAHPGVTYELISTYEVQDLVAGEADMALRFTREITDDRLIATKLTEVRSALYASAGYVARNGAPADAADFANHRFVVNAERRSSLSLNNWLLDRVAPERIASRCQNMEAMIAAIQAGIGVGALPLSIGEDDPGLVRVFGPVPGTSTFSWLVASPEAWKRPEVKAFAAFFAPRFRAQFRRLQDIA